MAPSLAAWLLPRLAAAGLGAILVGGAWLLSGPSERPAGLSGPIAKYLVSSDRLIATPVGTFQDLETLRNRPEQLVLNWARNGGQKK